MIVRHALLGAVLVPLASMATAQDLADVGNRLIFQAPNVAVFIGVLSFVLGVIFAIIGLMRFYRHSRQPQDPQSALPVAFVYILAGAMFVAVPSLIGSGVITFFGVGGDTTDPVSGFTGFD